MSWALVLPLLAGALLGAAAAPLARWLGPRATARLVPVTALLVAASTLVALAAVAVMVLARVAEIAEIGQIWVPALPAGSAQVPLPVGIGVGVAVASSLGVAGRRAVCVVVETVEAQRVCRRLVRRADGVHLLDDDRPRAFAVAGPTGRVVVSSGMLRSLSGPEQAAVLAHERSHLRRGHHLGLLAVQIAAAANPLLRPLLAVTALAVERDADEDAAVAVGDRRVVALALARAGLAGAAAGRAAAPASGLGAAEGDVPLRVEALLAPPVRPHHWLTVPVVAVALLVTWATFANGMSTDHQIHRARAAYSSVTAQASEGPADR